MAVSFREYTGTGAEAYQSYFVPAIANPVSDDLLPRAALRPGERVLDVACGTGVVTRRAAEQVGAEGSVTGVDVSPDMIEVAKATPTTPGADIAWEVADAADLPFPDASFDVALCQMGLMFMEDKTAALAEIRRTLVPGGRLVVNTPGTIQRPFQLMEEAIVEHISPDLGGFVRAVFSMNDPDALAGLLRDAGFEDVEAEEATVTLQLPAPTDFLWQYINLTPMGPIVEQAPEDAKAAMEAQVARTWEPFVVDGRTPLDNPLVVATGTRRT